MVVGHRDINVFEQGHNSPFFWLLISLVLSPVHPRDLDTKSAIWISDIECPKIS